MSNPQVALNPYAILFAALTQTSPEDWSNIQRFSWEEGNFRQAPHGPFHGNDVFAITVMEHKDGRRGQICYDLQDQVYFDCGEIRWSGSLEADVHSLALWSFDFEGALQARLDELKLAHA